MRVLYAYNQHRGGGGADNTTRATIEISRERGIDVEVFTRSSEELPKNFSGRWQAATSAIYSPDSIAKFRELLDRFKPDIVHAHEVFPLVTPWVIRLSARRGIPVVLSCLDYRLTCPIVTHLYKGEVCTKCAKGDVGWAVLRNCRQNYPESVTVAFYNTMVRALGLFSKYVSHYIAPSDFTARWLSENVGIPPDLITSNYCAVTIPETASDPAQGSYIAFAGRFTPEKGVSTFVKAARLSGLPVRASRNAHSLVIEDMPPEIPVDVTTTRAQLDAFYRGARMLVFPSTFFETFGLVAAEAMSHGVPVIASKMGAMDGLFHDEVEGLYFEPRNAEQLAAQMKRLWNDPELCRRLGRAGRKRAMELWTPDKHFERLMAVYAKVLCKTSVKARN